jgi:hypothetical protein
MLQVEKFGWMVVHADECYRTLVAAAAVVVVTSVVVVYMNLWIAPKVVVDGMAVPAVVVAVAYTAVMMTLLCFLVVAAAAVVVMGSVSMTAAVAVEEQLTVYKQCSY